MVYQLKEWSKWGSTTYRIQSLYRGLDYEANMGKTKIIMWYNVLLGFSEGKVMVTRVRKVPSKVKWAVFRLGCWLVVHNMYFMPVKGNAQGQIIQVPIKLSLKSYAVVWCMYTMSCTHSMHLSQYIVVIYQQCLLCILVIKGAVVGQ